MIEVRSPETRPAPVEVTTPIKPSEAIRLGCLLAPVQAFGSPGRNGEACVMATADRVGFDLTGVWPFGGRPECPACDSKVGFVHLNDDHRWSRERIADWLEGLGL